MPLRARRGRDRRRAAAGRSLRRRRRPPRRGRRAARGGRAGRPRPPLPGRRPDAARASQRELLDEVRRRLEAAGWRPATVDLTIVAARPRLGGHLDPMRDAIAGLLGLDPAAVNVKASTGNLDGAEGAGGRSRRSRSRRSAAAPMTPPTARHAVAARRGRSCRCDADRVGVYSCGPTVYGPAHIGNFRVVPVRRPARPLPALARLRGDLGDEHHRHRRQDHPRRGGRRARRSTTLAERYLARVPGRRRRAADDARRTSCRAPPSTSTQIVALIETLLDARPRLPHRRRLDLLPDRVVAGLRPAGPPRPGRAAGRGAGRGRRVRQGRRPRLRPVEGPEARRAVVGHGDRAGPARLAHRVLGDEHGPPRAVVRHPHRRRRPDLPAPRGRDRPERGGDRPDLRRTWLHCAHLQMGGAKMAKSTGNIARVGELSAAGVSPRALRLRAHLGPLPGRRSTTRDESLAAAAAALDRLDAAVAALGAYREDRPGRPDACRAPSPRRGTAFGAALDDDLNVSAALAVVFDLVRDLNRRIERRTPVDGRCRPGARGAARPRPGPGDPARCRRTTTRAGGSRRCSTRGPRRGPRATWPRRTGCATSSRRSASPSRTRATASAGAGPWRSADG